jgi:hypothetical protein
MTAESRPANPASMMAYVAIHPECGNAVYMGVDAPDMKADNAKDVAACIRKGHTIQHVTVETARTLKFCMCNRSKRRG